MPKKQSIGVSVTDEGVTFEMEGSASSLTTLLSALIVRFAKQLGKAYGDTEMWIDVICQRAKEELREGEM